METKENNNTASTHQEKARKLKKLRRWANRCQPIGNSHPYLGDNSSDLPLLGLQTHGNQ